MAEASRALTIQAVHYAAACGWQVFPLKPRDKIPPKDFHWRELATSDAHQVASWWRSQAFSNIGVATGAGSGFWVLDIDGPEAAEALAALEAVHGALPRTRKQLTGKGAHYLFAWPLDREVRNSAKKIGPGIDVRGEGGYIVAAPSIHPSGRQYRWEEGCEPLSCPTAEAPAWLLELACPPKPAPAPVLETRPRPRREGRATAYGQKALDNACSEIRAAGQGKRDVTLWNKALSIGALVAGEQIEAAYAREALISAGGAHVPACYTQAALEDKVDRAFEWVSDKPFRPAERRGPQPARVAPAAATLRPATAADQAHRVLEARGLWEAARPPICTAVMDMFSQWGLRLDGVPRAIDRFRVHARAPLGRAGETGPALLAPMTLRPDEDLQALAIMPLQPGRRRFTSFMGEIFGRSIQLTPVVAPADDVWCPLIVAIDLADGWALASEAFRDGGLCRLAIAPTLGTFAGGARGDRWGRVNLECPLGDPALAPWTVEAAGDVVLAVRQDLRGPEVKVRRFAGGTARPELDGVAAARFWGGLAAQAWKRAGAQSVKLLSPRDGPGFHQCAG